MSDYRAVEEDRSIQQPPKPTGFGKGFAAGAVLVTVVAAVIIAVMPHHKGGHDSRAAECEGDQMQLPVQMQYDILSKIDRSVDPCDDFYLFACGTWLNRTVLGPNETDYVTSFSFIQETVDREIASAMAEYYPFVAETVASCNDSAAANTFGAAVLTPVFTMIDAQVQDMASFFRTAGQLQARGYAFGAIFDWFTAQNIVTAVTNELYVQQHGVTLSIDQVGDSEYFPATAYEKVYPAFKQLEQDGLVTSANASFDNLLQVEEFLFNLTYEVPQIADLDPLQAPEVVNFTTLSGFAAATGLPIDAYFAGLSPSLGRSTRLGFVAVDSWKSMAAGMFKSAASPVNVQSARDYLKWRVVYGALRFLPDAYYLVANEMTDDGTFDTDGPYLWPTWPLEVTEPGRPSGWLGHMPSSMRPRSGKHQRGRGLDREGRAAKAARGMARDRAQPGLSRAGFCESFAGGIFSTWNMHQYLVQDFPSFDMELANKLVNMTLNSMRERLETVEWLDAPTRKAALAKLAALVPNVATDPYQGKPALVVDPRASPFANFAAVAAWQFNNSVALAGTPFDRHSYQGPPTEMPPWIQNAFYQPTSNTINLLPGLMLPPMFSPDLPLSINVAAYGMVIGHEITHGFDNNGRLFGPVGAVESWWSDKSLAQFEARTTCLVNQYSEFEEYGVHVRGNQTLGENIADGGGVGNAWRSYKAINPAPLPGMMGKYFTNDQLHFLYYAQTWCDKETEQAYLDGIEGDVHSPAHFRVTGPLSNFKPFAEAFKCRADQYMGRSLDPSKVCEVW